MADNYAQALDAVTEAKAAAARARIDNPDEHFPYKREVALRALETPPDPGTNNHPEDRYTSEQIIEASAAYVAAQEKVLENPNVENRRAYRKAAEALAVARQEHRADRVSVRVWGGSV